MDRSRDVGMALTEIRTVLSRAETARRTLNSAIINCDGRKWEWIDGEHVMTNPGRRDPDAEEMIAVLDEFIAAAGKWRRKGR